jgi:hypothetical protein
MLKCRLSIYVDCLLKWKSMEMLSTTQNMRSGHPWLLAARQCMEWSKSGNVCGRYFTMGWFFHDVTPKKGSHSDGMLNHPLGLQFVDGQWMMGSWDNWKEVPASMRLIWTYHASGWVNRWYGDTVIDIHLSGENDDEPWLVSGLEHFFPYIWNVTIPTDELHHFSEG